MYTRAHRGSTLLLASSGLECRGTWSLFSCNKTWIVFIVERKLPSSSKYQKPDSKGVSKLTRGHSILIFMNVQFPVEWVRAKDLLQKSPHAPKTYAMAVSTIPNKSQKCRHSLISSCEGHSHSKFSVIWFLHCVHLYFLRSGFLAFLSVCWNSSTWLLVPLQVLWTPF